MECQAICYWYAFIRIIKLSSHCFFFWLDAPLVFLIPFNFLLILEINIQPNPTLVTTTTLLLLTTIQSISWQLESLWTLADVTSWCIYTLMTTTVDIHLTFIHIWKKKNGKSLDIVSCLIHLFHHSIATDKTRFYSKSFTWFYSLDINLMTFCL